MFTGVTIYFNKDLGYIFGAHSKQEGTNAPVIVPPVLRVEKGCTDQRIIESITAALEISKKTPLYTGDLYEFWTEFGSKTFKAFSQKFTSVKIFLRGDVCRVQGLKLATKTGGYVADKEAVFECPVTELHAHLSEIKRLLSVEEVLPSAAQFLTLSGAKVTYTSLSDEYNDLGDGHTDAYQIFADTHNKNNVLSFMIDSGYASFSKADIKSAFTKYYGELLEFRFEEFTDRIYLYKISAKTSNRMIVSYLFEEQDALLEVLYQIELNVSHEEFSRVQRDFEQLVSSIRIN